MNEKKILFENIEVIKWRTKLPALFTCYCEGKAIFTLQELVSREDILEIELN